FCRILFNTSCTSPAMAPKAPDDPVFSRMRALDSAGYRIRAFSLARQSQSQASDERLAALWSRASILIPVRLSSKRLFLSSFCPDQWRPTPNPDYRATAVPQSLLPARVVPGDCGPGSVRFRTVSRLVLANSNSETPHARLGIRNPRWTAGRAR